MDKYREGIPNHLLILLAQTSMKISRDQIVYIPIPHSAPRTIDIVGGESFWEGWGKGSASCGLWSYTDIMRSRRRHVDRRGDIPYRRVMDTRVLRHHILDFLPPVGELPTCYAFCIQARDRGTMTEIKIETRDWRQSSISTKLAFWYAHSLGKGYTMARFCGLNYLEEDELTLEEALWHEDSVNKINDEWEQKTGSKSFRRDTIHKMMQSRHLFSQSEHFSVETSVEKKGDESEERDYVESYMWLGYFFGILKMDDIPQCASNVLDPLSLGRLNEAIPFLERGDALFIKRLQPNVYPADSLRLLLQYIDFNHLEHIEYNTRWDEFDDEQKKIMIELVGWGDVLADDAMDKPHIILMKFVKTYHSYLSGSTLWCFLWNGFLHREILSEREEAGEFVDMLIGFFERKEMKDTDPYHWKIQGEDVTYEAYILSEHRDKNELKIFIPLLKTGQRTLVSAKRDEAITFLMDRKPQKGGSK